MQYSMLRQSAYRSVVEFIKKNVFVHPSPLIVNFKVKFHRIYYDETFVSRLKKSMKTMNAKIISKIHITVGRNMLLERFIIRTIRVQTSLVTNRLVSSMKRCVVFFFIQLLCITNYVIHRVAHSDTCKNSRSVIEYNYCTF